MNAEIGRNPENRIFRLRSNFSRLLISQQTGSLDIQPNVRYYGTGQYRTVILPRRRRRRRAVRVSFQRVTCTPSPRTTSNLTPHRRTYVAGLSGHVCTASVPLTNLSNHPEPLSQTLSDPADSSLLYSTVIFVPRFAYSL